MLLLRAFSFALTSVYLVSTYHESVANFFFLLFEREKFKSSNVKTKPSGNNMLLLSSLNHTAIQLITLVNSLLLN